MQTSERVWSFSALDDYSCGEKFRLRRIEKVPRVVYFNAVAGSAFHEWSADFDRGHKYPDWPEYLDRAIEEERDGTPLERMRLSGRKTEKTPNKEDYTYWRDVLGPELCGKYISWSADKTIATGLPPDPSGNTTGIEYEVLFTVGGTQVRGFIDRILAYDESDLIVVDIKAGARPQTTVQLPTYALGARKCGIPARYGSLYYARKGTHTEPQDYSRWDEHRLSYLYDQAAAMEASGFFLPRPSEECRWCSVRDHCQFALS